MKSKFPQVFGVEDNNENEYLYLGGFQDLQDAEDSERLLPFLGLADFNLSLQAKRVTVGGQVDLALSSIQRTKSGIKRDFSAINKHKGKKIWKLNQEELVELWNTIDRDGSGVLDLHELQDFAAAFWEEQMARGDDRGKYMIQGTVSAETQIKLLRERLSHKFDTDKNGKIEKAEFISRWNAVAKAAFKTSGCSLM